MDFSCAIAGPATKAPKTATKANMVFRSETKSAPSVLEQNSAACGCFKALATRVVINTYIVHADIVLRGIWDTCGTARLTGTHCVYRAWKLLGDEQTQTLEAIMPFSLAVKAAIVGWTSDLVGVWVVTLSTIAVSLATLIYLADRDPVAVSFVVVAFAVIIGVVLRESMQKRGRA
jgi:hypothetical protein